MSSSNKSVHYFADIGHAPRQNAAFVITTSGYTVRSLLRMAETIPMSPEGLDILYVSQMPPSPPRSGAQARVHGLMTQLARRHDLTAAIVVDEEFDVDECRRAMEAYCREVVLVPNPWGRKGFAKRMLQVRSLVSIRSFERLRVTL